MLFINQSLLEIILAVICCSTLSRASKREQAISRSQSDGDVVLLHPHTEHPTSTHLNARMQTIDYFGGSPISSRLPTDSYTSVTLSQRKMPCSRLIQTRHSAPRSTSWRLCLCGRS
ncbi:hypothetical protein F5148DRAFT_256456 [Russula earlei]|uniref:Uncharacterized protein n=1 Tax=Russula earlei TaxID=71964 RepID=A0ACC0U341_9AGAM|nr:hypothetical protein F5148DRAFT_256456 [Russula earlei]